MKYDLKSNTRLLRERLERETDPVLRRNVATVIRHVEGEIGNRVDEVMATMVPEPTFHAFFQRLGGGDATPPKDDTKARHNYAFVQGGTQIRDMYVYACANRLVWTHFDVDFVVVDKHCIVTEGVMNCPATGQALKAMGHDVDDENAMYMSKGRLVVLWPFDVESGLLLGEEMYVDPTFFEDAETRKINFDEFLPGYETPVAMPAR